MEARELIAKNVAAQFHDGDLINLGIGIPTLSLKYVDPEIEVFMHGENGSIGIGGNTKRGEESFDYNIVDASGVHAYLNPGAACFDSLQSFALTRSGHLDATVLGAFEVDEEGNLANWAIPGRIYAGMGGAMDLVSGAKKVIVAMEHCNKKGASKILKRCTLPLTGAGVVSMIITELGIMEVTPEGLKLTALAPGVSVEEIRAKTEAKLIVPEQIGTMLSDD